jgi:2-C-methyl-D-erythritol 4-phosphate cytidylyltransferase
MKTRPNSSSTRYWPRPSSLSLTSVPVTVAALLLGAGQGLRLGASVPKAFTDVGGRTLLEHSHERFAEHPLVRDVLVLVPAAYVERAQSLVASPVLAGGVTRLDSVRVGLAALADDVDAVLVHDVARPFVPAAVIERVVTALDEGADAVVPGLPVTDTIKSVDAAEHVVATVDRTTLRAIQTPQGFRVAALIAAHEGAPEATDDAGLIEALGGTVVVVAGADESFKITRAWDLRVAEAIAARGGR